MTFSKYTIHHLDLFNEVHPLRDAGHYCVFWYQSIPLGEAYIDYRDQATPLQFWEGCIRAISPALKDFASGNEESCRLIQSMQPDLFSIRRVCEKVLAERHPRQAVTCEVSVVICTRDRAPWLRTCLQYLQSQYCAPFEIIVVDNASVTDDTRAVADAFNVRYIREHRPGLDIARNTGARAARGSIVAYTDDDTRPDRYWICRVSETFRDPAIAAMTGLVIAASLETEAEVIFEKFWPFNRGYIAKTYDAAFFNSALPSGPPVWEIGAGANMAFRKDVFDKVGYFDERLDVGAAGCSGDSELWYRLLACGLSIRYNPLAVVSHSHRTSIPGLRKQLYAYMRGFTVAILIQHQRFGHRGNLEHLGKVILYYFRLLKKGFPRYDLQYKTVFSEFRGILSGLIYFLRHRNTDPKIFSNDVLR